MFLLGSAIVIVFLYSLLAYRDLKTASWLLLALLPTYLIRLQIGFLPTTLLELLVLVLVSVWFLKGYAKRFDIAAAFGFYKWPTALLLTASLLAVFIAPDKLAALGLLKAYFIEPALVFLVFRSVFTKPADFERALLVLFGLAGSLTLLAFIQSATGLFLPLAWLAERRVTSLFPFPNALGLFLAPLMSAGVVFLCYKAQQKLSSLVIFSSASIVFGSLSIFLAKTEAALVAIPLALFVILFLAPVAWRFKLGLGLAGLILASSLFVFSDSVKSKILLQDFSGQVRMAMWQETVQLLKDRPLFGAGLAGYPVVFKEYHDPRIYEIFQYPHNVFLNFWVELGLLGLFAFLAFAAAVCMTVWRYSNYPLVLVGGVALLTMFIHGLVDVPFFKNDLALLTVFFLSLTLSAKPLPESTKDAV